MQVSPWGGLVTGGLQFFGGSPIFRGGLQFFGGVSNFSGGSPIFWGLQFLGGLQFFRGGLSNFLGVLQFFGGGSPIFQGGFPIFQGVSNFSGGSPTFLGGSPIFRGVGSLIFWGWGVKGDPPGTRHRNTVNVRPVRILLECILVLLCFTFVCFNLQFGVRSLQSIPELEVRLTAYRERDPVVTQELKDFEEEYDDLCESCDILDYCWDRNAEVIKKNRPFERELKTFKADVSKLKQEYEDCLKQDLTGYLL